eukprot:XP_001699692.1 predicted protein [Chlamydomonas reinhardtii]
MKFARLLRTTAEDLPELQCLFHIYKHLKKQLKQLPARAEGASAVGQQLKADEGTTATASSAPDDEEAKFTVVLTDHLQRLNDRFLEREETCVIQLERLEAEAAQCTATARAASAGLAVATAAAAAAANGTAAPEETYTVGGAPPQVLLLVHWSVLAYTATVKILKKHHKRTGLLLRAPQLGDLLSQPFCSSELMTGLARKAEACIQRLAEQLASDNASAASLSGPNVLEQLVELQQIVRRRRREHWRHDGL